MTAITNNKNNKAWLHIGILMAAIVVAYTRVFGAGFMSWDDIDYVFNTPALRNGIGSEQVRQWFSSYYIGNYQPLPAFTYALDHVLGGDKPLFYHLDSLLWHMGATALLYHFISRLQGNRWVAFFVAALFALHPAQTESVSWIAARNKGMNAVFFLSAMLFYLSYIDTGKRTKLVWTCIFGFMAYLCKATAVALPLALFAVDIWQRRPLIAKKTLLEKVPLLLLAIPIAITTLSAQKQVNFLEHHTQGVTLQSIVFAGYAYVQYIVQLLCPVRLSVLYPYPDSISVIHILYTIIAAGILALMLVAYRRKWYVLAGGLLFYTVNILPVLQFVQFGEVLMADRYVYIACIGIWYPVVYYLFRYFESRSTQMVAVIISSCLSIVFLAATFVRNDIWTTELKFWTSVLDTFPESAVAQYSIGGLYMKQGQYEQAELHLNNAVRLAPNNYKAWHNKGALHLRQGRAMEALDALNRSIAINDYYKAYFTRAMLHQGTGELQLAIADADKVLEVQPDNARAWYIKGDCTERLGNGQEALTYYNKAIELSDTEPLFFIRRGLLYSKLRQDRQALTDLDRAVTLDPDSGEALYYRGMVRYQAQQSPCADLNNALRHGYPHAQEALDKLCK